MADNSFSIAPPPPVTPVAPAAHAAPGPSTLPSAAARSQQQPQGAASHDTVHLVSAPVAKSLQLSDKLLAQIDQETARITSAQAASAGIPASTAAQTAAAQPAAARQDQPPVAQPTSDQAPGRFMPDVRPSAAHKDPEAPDAAQKAANSGQIPQQVMQGKAKALAQSGRSPEEIALELHLDLRLVEEYLGTEAASQAVASSASGQTVQA